MTDDTLDEAYERLSGTGPEFQGWPSNHGPMAADVLIRIGHQERLAAWVDRYRHRLEERPGERWRLEEGEWEDSLGDPSRLGDWLALFARLLGSEPWTAVLVRWWPRLVPGAPAAATHALIRTGHVVRALLEQETPLRVEELGQALGYWAARWQPAPGHPPLRGLNGFGQAMDDLPAADLQGGARARLRHIARDPSWSEAVASATSPVEAAEVPAALLAITDEAVRHYLSWAHGNPVMLVHAATAPRAAALVLPALPRDLWVPTFSHAWATSAAMMGAYRPAGPDRGPKDGAGLDRSPEEVAEAAALNQDEHVLKFTEVALEAHRRGVSEALPAAARAMELIRPAP